jgi:ornithine carbamoyltransferase
LIFLTKDFLMNPLYQRHFLTWLDFSESELRSLLVLAARLKQETTEKRSQARLAGLQLALIFEKNSTRTRCAFEVAARSQGAHVTYLDAATSQMGDKESAADTARVLSGMFDGIVYRGFAQAMLKNELAAYASVPVFNALTNEDHPTQALADVLTMWEASGKPLENIGDIRYAYVGDGRNNVSNALLIAAAKLGMDFRLAAPKMLWPDADLWATCLGLAKHSGARLTLTESAEEAVNGVDFIHTDMWVSMGEPSTAWAERIPLLMPYQVNASLMAATGNPEVKFLHCLPAFHDVKTQTGQKLAAEFPRLAAGGEVTHDVFESAAGLQFVQAENRLHTIKALLVAMLAESIEY